MQTLNRTVISGVAADQPVTSVALSTLTLSALSVQVTISGGTHIEGVFHVDGSNEDVPVGWAESVGSTTIVGNGSFVVGPLALCFRWTRLRWVRSGGSGGSLTASVMAQSGPSPSNGLTTLTPDPSGTFTNSTVTVDEFGRVTSASSGAAASGAVPRDAAWISQASLGANGFATFPYVTTHTTGTGLGTGALRARPWVVGRSATLTGLGLVVSGNVASAVARIGIYDSNVNGYPGTLLEESGELDCATTGRKLTTGLSVALDPSKVYWIAFLGGVAAPNLAVLNSATTVGFCFSSSVSTTVAVAHGFTVAQTYGPLPASYPAGASDINGATTIPVPLLLVS